jgi:hypothetical protein
MCGFTIEEWRTDRVLVVGDQPIIQEASAVIFARARAVVLWSSLTPG